MKLAYKSGHIPGALHVDFNTLTTDFPVASEDTESIPVVLYCKTGTQNLA